MPFRFRKNIRLVPGLRLNLSKSGASLSVGGKGLTYNIGRKGTRATVGLPGSGLSYSSYDGYKDKDGKISFAKILVIGLIIAAILVFYLYQQGNI